MLINQESVGCPSPPGHCVGRRSLPPHSRLSPIESLNNLLAFNPGGDKTPFQGFLSLAAALTLGPPPCAGQPVSHFEEYHRTPIFARKWKGNMKYWSQAGGQRIQLRASSGQPPHRWPGGWGTLCDLPQSLLKVSAAVWLRMLIAGICCSDPHKIRVASSKQLNRRPMDTPPFVKMWEISIKVKPFWGFPTAPRKHAAKCFNAASPQTPPTRVTSATACTIKSATYSQLWQLTKITTQSEDDLSLSLH